jgi:hypothetical protein
MATPRPARTKKLTAAITNPDNVASFTLTSHKTAASAARLASKSQAATGSVTSSESAGPHTPPQAINSLSETNNSQSLATEEANNRYDSDKDKNTNSGDSDEEVISKCARVEGM